MHACNHVILLRERVGGSEEGVVRGRGSRLERERERKRERGSGRGEEREAYHQSKFPQRLLCPS